MNIKYQPLFDGLNQLFKIIMGMKMAVVGSGIGGLSIACRLAAKGNDVTVFEKNAYPGGKLSHFELKGYQFDAGPSLFTEPENITQLFDDCGYKASDFFSFEKVETACEYFFSSGKHVTAYVDKDKFASELQSKLGENPENLKKYLLTAANAYETIGDIFLNYSLHHPADIWKSGKLGAAITNTKLAYLTSTIDQYNNAAFDKEETVQLFNRFATYNGSNPYVAPAMLTMIPHLEQNQGTYYPHGGMISITNAVHKLALKLGVTFHFEHPVDSIETKNGKVVGLIVKEEFKPFDTLVSNMDAYYTYKKLLSDNDRSAKITKQERSSSAIIFYWGVKRSFRQLGLHNIYFSGDYKQEFDHIFNKGSLYQDPTIYINITSKMEASQAPDGCENWFVMVNAPKDSGQDWGKIRSECRQQVLDKLSAKLGVNLADLIEVEDYLDPPLIDQRTASYTGSLYGTSSNSRFAAFLRHPNDAKHLKGLYFVGGSVHPGGGIPLCIKSAKIVDHLISKKQH